MDKAAWGHRGWNSPIEMVVLSMCEESGVPVEIEGVEVPHHLWVAHPKCARIRGCFWDSIAISRGLLVRPRWRLILRPFPNHCIAPWIFEQEKFLCSIFLDIQHRIIMFTCEAKRLFFVVIQTARAKSDHNISECKRIQDTTPKVVWLQLVTNQVSQRFIISRIKK